MRQTMVMGNWKMNGGMQKIGALLSDLIERLPKVGSVQTVVFPPAIYIPLVQMQLLNTHILWGAQNIYPSDAGAFTGELSLPMIKEFGCRYVLVGHSERRNIFHEDKKFVAEKFHQAKEHGIIPVFCVGETLAERQKGLTEDVLKQQLLAVTSLGTNFFRGCVIAYEPVWAIGTGKTATPEQAQNVHAFIRALVAEFDAEVALDLPILYGGSVNAENAEALFNMPDIDGGLVGGASLDARQFVEIVKCIN